MTLGLDGRASHIPEGIARTSINHRCGVLVALILLWSSSMSLAQAVRWDYLRDPVKVMESPPASGAVIGLCAASAFDGYGTQGSHPGAGRAWHLAALPTDAAPFVCDLDYGKPAPVSAFVHYFSVPDGRDYRMSATVPSAFRRVRIKTGDDGKAWNEVAMLKGLPSTCPQVLPIPEVKASRYWRIEVLELAPGATVLMTYEIETYTGGVPTPAADPPDRPDLELPARFAERARKQAPAVAAGTCEVKTADAGGTFIVTSTVQGKQVNGGLAVFASDAPVSMKLAQPGIWRGQLPDGEVILRAESVPVGCLLSASYEAKPDQPVKFQSIRLKLTAPSVQLYYVPAYAWSHSPVQTMVNCCVLQTRMAGLGLSDRTLCLVPGSDHGSVGILDQAAQTSLIVGAEPKPVLIAGIPGDWWAAYQCVVRDVYGFSEPRQTVPFSEIQFGISRYLLRDDIWEPAVGTFRSWPDRDPHTKLMGFDCFNLYGPPYSMPALWARYVMNGDKLALDRCRSIAHWLCESSVRMAEGPCKGAFYTLQRFGIGEKPDPGKRGATQGWGTEYLTSQSTGTALWSLVYYRQVTDEKDAVIDRTIDEAAQWLLKTQLPEGGWPYGHKLDGNAVTEAVPGSGTIWNIWALWRLGKQTGDARFAQAAERGKGWYAKTFVEPHHYHGYWEDVGPGSREGYEAGIATVVFAEMGDKDLALTIARDAVQWVFTRQIEPREPSNSAGLVAEQTGWPPASYCNPMMGLAAWTAWQLSGDDFWRPFAMIPKAVGWWYEPDSGAMTWIVDATQMAPIGGPVFESWWTDWCIAQVGSVGLRWQIRELNRRLGSVGAVDEETLRGSVLGQAVTAWAPRDGLRPILPAHGQMNWLGLRSENRIRIAFMNDGPAGTIACPLDSRDVRGGLLWPMSVHRIRNGTDVAEAWTESEPVSIGDRETIILEYGLRR